MKARIHRARQLRSSYPGIEAMALASNHTFPRHAHDQLGIGTLLQGAQRSWSGIGAVEAAAGDVITVNPGEMHDGAPIRHEVRSWHMLYLDPGLVGREVRDEGLPAMEIARPALRDRALAGRITALFAAVTASDTDRLAAEGALLAALMHALMRYGSRRPGTIGHSPCVGAALRRLDAAPEAPVSLAELAALCGASRFQLLRGFAREVGTTPHAYRLQRRVGLARRLLAAGQQPADAAAAAGFADQSHLTRAFVRHLGVTPGRYRTAVI